MFLVVAVLLLVCRTFANNSPSEDKFALFLLGDSTSVYLYTEGLIPTLSCKEKDPYINYSPEAVDYKLYSDNTGLLCSSSEVTRIGYMFHWGVFPDTSDYIGAWGSHRLVGGHDTTNSRVNILNAIKEFQNRSSQDNSVVFVFSSTVWDAFSISQWMNNKVVLERKLLEYKLNLMSLVIEMMQLMRTKDTIVLERMHYLGHHPAEIKATANILDDIILSTANFLDVPLFDLRRFVHDDDKHLKDRDNRHQNAHISVIYAKNLANRDWALVNASLCSPYM